MCVLGTEPGSSARAANVLNHHTISSAPYFCNFANIFGFRPPLNFQAFPEHNVICLPILIMMKKEVSQLSTQLRVLDFYREKLMVSDFCFNYFNAIGVGSYHLW